MRILATFIVVAWMTTTAYSQDKPIVIRLTTAEAAINTALPQATFIAVQGGNSQASASPYSGYWGTSSPEYLLMTKQIQEELALEDTQIEKINAARKDIQKRRQELYKGATDIAPEKRTEFYQEMNLIHQELLAEQIAQILHPKQKSRLEQIQYQMQIKSRGAYALEDPKLTAALGITEEQLKELRAKNLASQRVLALEYQKMRQAAQREVLAEVLSKEQKQILEKLSGGKFELKPVQRSNFNLLPSGSKAAPEKK